MARPLKRDLVGLKFGRLTVLKRAPSDKSKRQAMWICRCSCGTRCIKAGGGLNRGTTNSCGCLIADTNRRLRRTHGMRWSRVYGIWQAMKNRCYNQNQPHYPRYGGRGIYVCKRWRESFEAFYADMENPPTETHSIDRIKNNGPYSPANCRWATRSTQNRNQRPRRRKAV